MTSPVVLTELSYPVLLIRGAVLRVKRSADELSITTRAGLSNKLFEQARLVDATGRCWEIARAEKLHGIGAFGGWNIFLNQRIRVNLLAAESPIQMPLSEIKALVVRALSQWQPISTRGDADGLFARIEVSDSVREIADLLGD